MRAKTNNHIEPGLENPKNPINPTDSGAADDDAEYPPRPEPTFTGVSIELVPVKPTRGHDAGVTCYRQVARVLKRLLRDSGLRCRRIRPLDAEDDQRAAEDAAVVEGARFTKGGKRR